ncbi:MAG: cyclase family protein [Acidimicrobiia bacterium]|nr:cyclase family protein [Acidimicrobiia bacterium]
MSQVSPTIAEVLELCKKYSNWGRWGPDDQRGTLNFIDEDMVRDASRLVRRGKVFSLALPFDDKGPQVGAFGRFNPIHLMIRDGCDAITGTTVRDFYGGRDRHIRGTDDVVIMPLQCGTQWDALSHIVHDGKIYNGYPADNVSSKGALKNDITQACNGIVGRGVLLDMARHKGKAWLEPGEVITDQDLASCARAQGVDVRSGDIVLVRTGQLAQVRTEGKWGSYAGGSAPGLGLDSLKWLYENQVAAAVTDTWGAEVLPNETEDVFQPLHIVGIVYMGLMLGEIFDLEELACDCDVDKQYDFFFTAPPLPFTGAVGSPVNPLAIK